MFKHRVQVFCQKLVRRAEMEDNFQVSLYYVLWMYFCTNDIWHHVSLTLSEIFVILLFRFLVPLISSDLSC